MENSHKSIAATVFATMFIVAGILYAPIELVGGFRTDHIITAVNYTADFVTPASGPAIPVAIVAILGAIIAGAQVRALFPQSERQEKRQANPGLTRGRQGKSSVKPDGNKLPADWQMKPMSLGELEAETRKQFPDTDRWGTSDHIAWTLQSSDKITFRQATDVLHAQPHCANIFLTDADFQEIQRLWAEKKRPTEPHKIKARPVLIAHKARLRGQEWSGASSHFGGMPRLGDAPWPRGKDGRPLPFAAQIDLADLAGQCPETPLPSQGSLAFFLNDGAVIFVPPEISIETLPPADLPHAYEECGYPLPQHETLRTQRLFPYRPVDLIGLELPGDLPATDGDYDVWDAIWQAQNDAIPAALKRREHSFSVHAARGAGVRSADQTFWYAAELFNRQLRQALAESGRREAYHTDTLAKSAAYRLRLEGEAPRNDAAIAESCNRDGYNHKKIEAIRDEASRLAEFADIFANFAAGRNPWQAMSGDEAAILADAVREARDKYSEHCSYHTPHGLDDLRTATVKAMLTGDAAAFAALPDDMLAFVNDGYRLSAASQHQIFGLGACIQDALSSHLGDLLLLQIGYDDLPEFVFGDVGVFQFWISPEDAAARRWDQVTLTFECG